MKGEQRGKIRPPSLHNNRTFFMVTFAQQGPLLSLNCESMCERPLGMKCQTRKLRVCSLIPFHCEVLSTSLPPS